MGKKDVFAATVRLETARRNVLRQATNELNCKCVPPRLLHTWQRQKQNLWQVVSLPACLSACVSACLSVVTFVHELCDDVDGLLGHHSVERHQLVVPEFLHDLGLLQEGLRRHRARFQGLDGHFGRTVPRA